MASNGIHCEFSGTDGSNYATVQENTVEVGDSSTAVYVEDYVTNANITGNRLRAGATSSGVYLDPYADNNTIKMNTVEVGPSSSSIYLALNNTNYLITRNWLSGGSNGIWGNDEINGGTISSNEVRDTDTGIRLDHTDFTGRILSGYDAVSEGGDASDCNGHGTHVAGTVGGTTYGIEPSKTTRIGESG